MLVMFSRLVKYCGKRAHTILFQAAREAGAEEVAPGAPGGAGGSGGTRFPNSCFFLFMITARQ